ncbi:MAG: beta-lactamase family protein [Clostridia bacterium]|nr:beta-lactamase family protein [Clostridia bacterium]
MLKRLLMMTLALCMFLSGTLAEDIPLPDEYLVVDEEDEILTADESAAAPSGLNPELDATLHRLFAQNNTTGAVVVVARGDRILYHYDYGLADKQEKKPVTPQTYFKTASVTKMISGIRVMQLVEEGKLDLDTPIDEYLGYPVKHPRYQNTPITIRMLMSHTSSIGGHYYAGSTLKTQLRNADWLSRRPGYYYRYSNFGAGILGSLMEIASGKDLNTCVDEGLFQPMGVDAAYRVWLLDQPDDAAMRYNEEGKAARKRNFYITEPYDPNAGAEKHYDLVVGDIWIRGDDLCRIGMMMCQGGTLDGVTILRPETIAEMTSSQQGKGGVTADSPYGLCVHRAADLLPDRMVYGHQGRSDGVLCNLYWEPESGFVFALITNGCQIKLKNYICRLSRNAFAAAWAYYGQP